MLKLREYSGCLHYRQHTRKNPAAELKPVWFDGPLSARNRIIVAVWKTRVQDENE
jgi:hypothetical protein